MSGKFSEQVSRPTAAQQTIAASTVCVLLVRGEAPSGGKIYAYMAIRADRLEDFLAAQAQGTFYPEDFGVVIASGAGDPEPDVRERMTREYGFQHDAMLDLADVESARKLSHNLVTFISGSGSHG